MLGCETNNCTPSCDNVFDLVHVSYLIRGGTRVMWQLIPSFNDVQPWSFQLQTGNTGSQDSDDWINVGLPVENTCYAIDPVQRNYNKYTTTYYRIKLETPDGIYYSDPVNKAGILNPRDWRLAQEVVRKEKLRFRYSAQEGYLLKRRNMGQDCTRCLDIQTNEITDPYCPQCLGTGKQCGYYYPMSCIWADISPVSRRTEVDNNEVRGTIKDIRVSGRMLMLPIVDSLDVWVNKKTDERYYIHSIQSAAEMRGVPIIANVEMRPIAFTDVIYSVAIPQQDAWLQPSC